MSNLNLFSAGAINVGRHGMTFIPTKKLWLRNLNIIHHGKKIQEVIINELLFPKRPIHWLVMTSVSVEYYIRILFEYPMIEFDLFIFLEKNNLFCSIYSGIAVCITTLLYRIWIYYFWFLLEIVNTIEIFLSNYGVTNLERNLASCYGAQHFLQYV